MSPADVQMTFNSGILWRSLLFNLNKMDGHFIRIYPNDNNKKILIRPSNLFCYLELHPDAIWI